MLAIAFVFSMVSQLRRGRTKDGVPLFLGFRFLALHHPRSPGASRNHTVQATTVRHLNVSPRPLVLEVIRLSLDLVRRHLRDLERQSKR
jgi:hypothetical protein